jgi:Cu+-exporting ATPase
MAKTCYHCGEDCIEEEIIHEGHSFCCMGCKTVYSILNASDLEGFYELEEQGGTKTTTYNASKYAYLDEPEIIEKLIDYKDEELTVVSFYIPIIHCSSCIWLLEKLYKLQPGIKSSLVNFTSKNVRVTYKPEEISLRKLVELLHSIGYPPAINLNDLDKKGEKRGIPKSLLYKLGVAGFAFGNIMLAALPEYFATPENPIDPRFATLFSYLSFGLVLPVVFYSSTDYFVSAWQAIKHRGINIDIPIALGIATLFLRSLYEIAFLEQPGYFDSLSGLVFYLLIGKAYQSKTYANIAFDRDYKSYFPISVTKLKSSAEYVIPLTQLKVGDRLLIRNGEIIPADSILISKQANIDSSFITGEEKTRLMHTGDKIYAGCKQVGPGIEVEVIKTVAQSELTQLWNDSNLLDQDRKLKFESLTNSISTWFTAVVLGVAILALVYWVPSDTGKAIQAFTAVLIVACPCALALAAPITFGQALRRLGNAKLFFKDTLAIERFGKLNQIVFDKTGTITQSHVANISYTGEPLNKEDKQVIRSGLRNSYHPLSMNLYASFSPAPILVLEHYKEITGKGIEMRYGGKIYRLGAQSFCGFEAIKEAALSTRVYLQIDGAPVGYFAFSNQYRPGLKQVVERLKGYDLALITGDNESEKSNLEEYFGKHTALQFNQNPTDKLHFIQNLQKEHKKVLMLGDGLNDAGALAQSDVGISVAEDTNNFSPACDGILDASQFKKLPDFIRFAENAILTVKISMGISFVYNIVGLTFAVKGMLTPLLAAVLMPTSSISVVLISSFTIQYFARILRSSPISKPS